MMATSKGLVEQYNENISSPITGDNVKMKTANYTTLTFKLLSTSPSVLSLQNVRIILFLKY